MSISHTLTVPPVPTGSKAAAIAITFRILESFEDAVPHFAAWNDVVLRSGADIYQTVEWCCSWWNHYGRGRKLRIILCFSGETLLGVIPAFVETLWLGIARVRVAKLLGSDYSLQLCNLPVMPEVLDLAVSEAVRLFLGDEKCDVAWSAHCPVQQQESRRFYRQEDSKSNWWRMRCVSAIQFRTRFDLPGTHEEYQRLIGGRQRGNYNRSLKQFEMNRQILVDVVAAPDAVVSEFERFQAIHEAQWAVEGKLGHFGDWPQSAEFNSELVRRFGKLGMVRFFRILADGQVASSQFCFIFGGTNYWRLPGRECKPEWES